MSIGGVNATNNTYTTSAAAPANTASKSTKNEETKNQSAEQDVYVSSESKKTAAAKPDQKKLSELIAQSKRDTEAFTRMIEKLLNKQGLTAQQAISNGGMVKIDEETRLAAQEAVSEDGYYGVKQTSQRILDFAVAFAGDDPAKLETMKKAFEKGFQQAMGTWGAKKLTDMPQISQDTYAAVMQGFDDLMGK